MTKIAKANAPTDRVSTGEYGQSTEIGTGLANYRDTPSCEHTQPQSTWGGARNRADRTSEYLSDRQVAGLVEAAKFAMATGRIFQRHWTIHYGKAGIDARDGARFIGSILDKVSKQSRREGGRLTAIWVRECASAKGEHVHILLHLPAAMRLHGRTRRWIEAADGIWKPGVSKVRIIGGQLSRLEYSREARLRANAENVLRYLLKGASDDTGERFDLHRSGEGGRIIGKRCGWTENLGKKARSAFLETNTRALAREETILNKDRERSAQDQTRSAR